MSISGISGINSYYLSQLMGQSGSSSSSGAFFSSIDKNGDGSISKSELTAYLENMGQGFTNSVLGSQTDTTSLVSLLQDAAQLDSATGTTASMDQLFSKIDMNGDGSISESELETFAAGLNSQSTSSASNSDTSAIDQLFNAIDTNGDGSISKSELEAFESKMESAMSAPPPPADSTASLDNLLQSLGIDSTTASTTTSAATSSTPTSSTSDQTSSASAFMSLLMEAISSYMQFGQSTAAAAGTMSVIA